MARFALLALVHGMAVAWGGPLVLPSPAQLRYQSTDFVALIHFNMGTFSHNGDPSCDPGNWDVKAPYAAGKTNDPATFNPRKLNTTQWMESITGLGANIAVLTAKHGCGFLLWPTKTTLPDGSPYGYNVMAEGAAIQYDVLQQFVDSARAAGVGYGFYYSIVKNFYLCHSFTGDNICGQRVLPRQQNMSEEAYLRIAADQVKELWTQYGNLTEIWFDSALAGLGDLANQLQPQAANSPANPIGWCGTESGHPSRDVGPGDIWNTGKGYLGDINGTFWKPKFCDLCIYQEHTWFWTPGVKARTLAEMIEMYHDIVGRGMNMEIAFSPNRDGLIDDDHAAVYKGLGAWVRQCYGSPLAVTSGVGSTFTITVPAAQAFDRIQLQEDLVLGQRVRKYALEQLAADGSWTTLVTGHAIGRKRIHLLPQAIGGAQAGTVVRLRVEEAVAEPVIKLFGAFAPCSKGTPEPVEIQV